MEIETGEQLKGYIRKEIEDHSMSSNYAYIYYFTRQFLKRLYGVATDTFVLKGSYGRFANLGKLIRPITDLDIITNCDIKDTENIINKIITSDDQIKFRIVNKFLTSNETLNYGIECDFDTKTRKISLDFKKETLNETRTIKLPKIFSQDELFEVNSETLEEHLVQKLICIFINLKICGNSPKKFRRFKDFYDVHKLLEIGNFDECKVFYLLNQTIKNNKFFQDYKFETNIVPQNFINEYQAKWDNDGKKYEFDEHVTFDNSINSFQEFISTRK